MMSLSWLLAACSSGLAPAEPPAATTQPQPSISPSASPEPTATGAVDASPAEPESRAPVLPEPPATPPQEPKPRHDFHQPLPPRYLPESSPAKQHANLAPWKCRQLLKQRKLPFKRDKRPTPGIATALRIQGPLNGVTFHAPREKSPYGALDCRLALTLEEFSKLLIEHDIVWVRADNMWRPNARLPGRRSQKSQHNYGLAIDIMEFRTKDGTVLNVENDFAGERGAPVCGPEAELSREDDKAIRLRNLICDAARRGIFNHMLTPNYDEAHRDHFHLDVKRDARSWMIK